MTVAPEVSSINNPRAPFFNRTSVVVCFMLATLLAILALFLLGFAGSILLTIHIGCGFSLLHFAIKVSIAILLAASNFVHSDLY